MSPSEFCAARIAAIVAYNEGRKSGWHILGSGTIASGQLGAVRVKDQYGCVGLVAQPYAGSESGTTLTELSGYEESNAADD